MTSKERLQQKLDEIPDDYPYEKIQQIKDLHRFFHEAGRIDEGVAYSFTNLEEFTDLLKNFKPTNLEQALNLLKEISSTVNLFQKGTDKVLTIISHIYRDHYPPNKIDHQE